MFVIVAKEKKFGTFMVEGLSKIGFIMFTEVATDSLQFLLKLQAEEWLERNTNDAAKYEIIERNDICFYGGIEVLNTVTREVVMSREPIYKTEFGAQEAFDNFTKKGNESSGTYEWNLWAIRGKEQYLRRTMYTNEF
jgi:hypothetical protein